MNDTQCTSSGIIQQSVSQIGKKIKNKVLSASWLPKTSTTATDLIITCNKLTA